MHGLIPSVTPGAIIGYRKNGSPIRLLAGGSEPAPEPPAGGTGTATAEPPAAAPPATPPSAPGAQPGASSPAPGGQPGAQPPATTGSGAPSGQEPQQPPPGQQGPAGSVDELPPWAQREFRKLRDENASSRVKNKQLEDRITAKEGADQKLRDDLAKAFGIKPEEVTPEQLVAQREAERDAEKTRADGAETRARASDVKLAVFQQAAALKADGNALLDSVAFLRTLDGFDPAAEDFGDRVKGAIEAAVEANARYKLDAGPPAPAPKPEPKVPSSGPPNGQFTGPPNAPRQWTEEDVRNASPSEVQEAINKGLLSSLGFGPSRRNKR